MSACCGECPPRKRSDATDFLVWRWAFHGKKNLCKRWRGKQYGKERKKQGNPSSPSGLRTVLLKSSRLRERFVSNTTSHRNLILERNFEEVNYHAALYSLQLSEPLHRCPGC